MPPKEASPSFRDSFLGGLGLFLLTLLMFGDVLFSNSTFVLSDSGHDLASQFLSWRIFGFNELKRGHLVLWNPYYLCGTPFFGNFQSALLYPPNWLYMVLPTATAINLGIALHVFLAGLFTYFWALYKRFHPVAAFLAGTVFMFGGGYFLHLYAGHLSNLCAMIWAPLIFLAVEGWVGTSKTRWLFLGAFAVSVQVLAGHPQYVYFTGIAVGLFSLIRLFRKRGWSLTGLGIVGFYLAAALLTAIQLWTGLQAMAESGRSLGVSWKIATSFSFPPENLLTLVFPEIFGNLRGTHYWGRWFLWEVSIFIGFVAFFLVARAFRKDCRKEYRSYFIMVFLAFLLSLGAYLPFFRQVYDWVPGFQSLRGLCKFDFLTCLFLSMLAGGGFHQILKSKKIPGWLLSGALGAGLLSLAGGVLVFHSASQGLDGEWDKWFTSIHWLKKIFGDLDPEMGLKIPAVQEFIRNSGIHSALSFLLGGITCLLLALTAWGSRWNRRAVYGTVFLAVAELFIFARMNRPCFDLASWANKLEQEKKFHSGHEGDYRVFGTSADNLLTHGYDIWEDEPMVPVLYARFVCASQGIPENELSGTNPLFTKFTSVFRLVRLRYLLNFDLSDRLQSYELPFKPLPRIQLIGKERVLGDSNEMLKALFSPGFDPQKEVLLNKETFLRPEPVSLKDTVSYQDLSTEEMEIRAQVSHPCLLLVTDNYFPGWKVLPYGDSDQQGYEVLPGDYFLRAIPLTEGKHHFKLQYAPIAFEVGKWISIISCLLYVGILVFCLRKRIF